MTHQSVPLTFDQFKDRFAREVLDYHYLIASAFGGGDQMCEELDKLSYDDRLAVLAHARKRAAEEP